MSPLGRKVFEEPFPVARDVKVTRMQPLIVCQDLRRGSLDSLSIYLVQEGGIPDRQVAVELRKLLSGSRQQSKYRMVVIDHPDSERDIGGRPPSKSHLLSEKEAEILRVYEGFKVTEGKVYLARDQTMQALDVSKTTFDRARSKANKLKAAEERKVDILQRRDQTLASVSEAPKKRSAKKSLTKPAQVS